ncbi:MAG: hypothetical protein GY754_33585 [bacterium]|nr:hypothetical protein [bacterium]
MKKKFNTAGTCIPERNYMVNLSSKLNEIMEMIEEGEYFTINRPRQYGKTTTLYLLKKLLLEKKEYLPIKLSFEGMGPEAYESGKNFSHEFLRLIFDAMENLEVNGKRKDLVQDTMCRYRGLFCEGAPGKGWVLRDVAVQRLYWLVSGQGYGDSGKECGPCEGIRYV